MTIRFLPPSYNGGRHLLMCGEIEAGAAFRSRQRPRQESVGLGVLAWRDHARNGSARPRSTEEKAKAALMAALADWLEKAGLEAAA